jgi:hypothetical protein
LQNLPLESSIRCWLELGQEQRAGTPSRLVAALVVSTGKLSEAKAYLQALIA